MLGFRKLHSSGQHGDTIVEVLIAAAVVSLVLAGGYAITNRNIGVTQDTNERNQALQLAQSQVELLRSYAMGAQADGSLPPATDTTTQFCLDSSGGLVKWPSAGNPADACKVPNSSNAFDYIVSTKATGNSSASDTTFYQVTVQWDNVHGTQSSVSLDYGPQS